jgi:hypothetical protein
MSNSFFPNPFRAVPTPPPRPPVQPADDALREATTEMPLVVPGPRQPEDEPAQEDTDAPTAETESPAGESGPDAVFEPTDADEFPAIADEDEAAVDAATEVDGGEREQAGSDAVAEADPDTVTDADTVADAGSVADVDGHGEPEEIGEPDAEPVADAVSVADAGQEAEIVEDAADAELPEASIHDEDEQPEADEADLSASEPAAAAWGPEPVAWDDTDAQDGGLAAEPLVAENAEPLVAEAAPLADDVAQDAEPTAEAETAADDVTEAGEPEPALDAEAVADAGKEPTAFDPAETSTDTVELPTDEDDSAGAPGSGGELAPVADEGAPELTEPPVVFLGLNGAGPTHNFPDDEDDPDPAHEPAGDLDAAAAAEFEPVEIEQADPQPVEESDPDLSHATLGDPDLSEAEENAADLSEAQESAAEENAADLDDADLSEAESTFAAFQSAPVEDEPVFAAAKVAPLEDELGGEEPAELAEPGTAADPAEDGSEVLVVVLEDVEPVPFTEAFESVAEVEQPADSAALAVAAVAPVSAPALRPGDLVENHIAVWDPVVAQQFRDSWRELQVRFVDDPELTLTDAQALVAQAVQALAQALLAEQDRIDPRTLTESADTETLRIAFREYRNFLERVLAL